MDVRVLDDMEELGRAFRAARYRKDWSQEVAAAKAGVSNNTVSKIEAGGTVNTRQVLWLAEALGLRLVLVEPGQGTEATNAPVDSA